MARVSIDEMILKDTADAIRAKGGDDELMSPTSFASAITAIPTMEVTIDKTLTQEDQAAEAKATGDRIAEEATARAAADTALQQSIAAETAARTSAVNTEIANRENGDTFLQTQINQIIAPSGEAPSAAEVENARIDVDGVTHTTLGEAIREQVGELNNALDDNFSLADYVDLNTVEMTEGSYLSATGEIKTNANYLLSDYIELPDGVNTVAVNRNIYLPNSDTVYPQTSMVFWYRSDKTYIGTGTNAYSDNLLTSTLSNFYNAKYVRINFARYRVKNFARFGYFSDIKFVRYISESEDLNNITTPGIYIIPVPTGVDNTPFELNRVGWLTVYTAPFNNYCVQIYTTPRGQFTRATDSTGTWSSWRACEFGANVDALQSTDITDLNELAVNRVYLRGDTSTEVANLPFDSFLGTIVTFNGTGSSNPGTCQLAVSKANRIFTRRSWGSPESWNDWTEILSFDNISEVEGLLYEYTGHFTATETLQTDFILQPHTTYLVKFNTARTNTINVFGSGYTSSYKRANPWNDTVLFTNDGVKRYLSFYNPNGQLDTVNVTVFVPDSIAEKATDVPTVYRVTKTAVNGNYTSLSKCLYDLKDDNRPKIIEIWEGDYDIYSEYKELYDAGLLDVYTGNDPSMDYFPYCVWVPKNTHIIGKGIVRLKWMPDPSEVSITAVQCRCISPLNVAASCTIENVEVYCKNGRYCLHNDGLGKTEFTGAVQKYINCRFYKYPNDTEESSGLTYGFLPTTGFGIDRAMHHVYENCVFVNYASERAFYGHSRAAAVSGEKQSSDITLVNCVIDTDADRCIKFGNSASNRNIHIRTMFNGCYISGNVVSQREASGGLDCANGFDMQFLNCGDVSVKINDPDNPYPPKSYNTNLTIVS